MVQSRRRTSFLGSLAMLAGFATIGLVWLNPPNLPIVPIGPAHLRLPVVVGLAGIILAVVGVVAAASSPQTNVGAPFLATLVCAAAVALAIKPGLLTRARGIATKPPPPATPPTAHPVAGPRTPLPPHVRTIFDNDYPSSTQPIVKAPAPSSGPAPVAQPDQAATIRAAREKWFAANRAVIRSLQSDATYRAARADAASADADLRDARLTYQPGSAELIAASKNALQARNKLQQIIWKAEANNPASQEALKEFRAAEAAGKE